MGEKGAYVVVGLSRTAQILGVDPILSIIPGSGKATKFKFGSKWQVHSHGPSEQKPIKNSGKGRIPGLPKFFEYPLLSQERVKLQTSNFVRTFLVSIGTKADYKFREK